MKKSKSKYLKIYVSKLPVNLDGLMACCVHYRDYYRPDHPRRRSTVA